MRETKIAMLMVAALLAVPGAATAATKDVIMGTPPQSSKAFEKAGADINAYFPSTTTIHVGDKVRFIPASFHNVDLPPRGSKPLPLVSTNGTVSGANDAAGQPYWFNGQGAPGFTPELGRSGFGKSFTYTGSKRVDSGLPLSNKPKPMTVKFTKKGSFTFFCSIHAGMKGTVKVVAASKSVPSAAQDRARVKKQIARAAAVAKTLPKASVPANTVDVGVAGKGGVELFAFVPSTLSVPLGSTVKFRMSPGTYDVHTATTGPGDPEREPGSFLGKLAASFNAPMFDPAAVYPSDPPNQVASLTPQSHGNGFWNAGAMDGSSASPLPPAGSVKFAAPGTYTFFCLIHPFMKATVTVK